MSLAVIKKESQEIYEIDSYPSNGSNKSVAENSTNLNSTLMNLPDSNKWIIELNWDVKNQLITLLDKFTKSLLSEAIDEKDLIENKDDIVKILINSKLRLDEQNCNKLILKIDNKFRYMIIDLLIKNEYLAINYRKTNDHYKSKLINLIIIENNKLTTKLINLATETVNDNLNNKKRKLDHIPNDETKIEISDLKNDIKNVREEVDELKKQLDKDRLENKKLKTEYDLKLNDLNSQLIDSKSIKLKSIKESIKNFFNDKRVFISESFNYLNLEWSIIIKTSFDKIGNKKYLEFYLNVKNILENSKWECKTTYCLILKNNLPDRPDKIHKSDYTFKDSMARGLEKFISEDELLNPKNGFLKNDTIYLEVHLNIDKLIRYI